MKKVFFIIFSLLILAACDNVHQPDIPGPNSNNYFVRGAGEFQMLVDKEQRTQYIMYSWGIALYVDSLGKPILYEGQIP